MSDDARIYTVRSLLFDFVKSPSLRHIRDPHAVNRLAQDINSLDRSDNVWRQDLSSPGLMLMVRERRDWIGPTSDSRRTSRNPLAIHPRIRLPTAAAATRRRRIEALAACVARPR